MTIEAKLILYYLNLIPFRTLENRLENSFYVIYLFILPLLHLVLFPIYVDKIMYAI